MVYKIKSFFVFLVYCIPLSLFVSPFIFESVALYSVIFVISLLMSKTKINFLDCRIFYFGSIFSFLMILSSLLSEHIIFSLQTSIPYMRWVFFCLFIIYLINTKKNFLYNFLLLASLTTLLISIDSFVQFFSGRNLLRYELLVPHRVSSFFKSELVMGSYVLYFFPFILVFIKNYVKKNNYKNLLTIISVLICGLTIFISGERSSFYLFILFVLILFICETEISLKTKLIGISLHLLFLFLILNYKSIYVDRMVYNFINSFDKKSNLIHDSSLSHFKNFYIFSPQHEKHIVSAYLMFREAPYLQKIFGNGPKNFRKLCNDKKFCNYAPGTCCTSHPHNTPVQILAEIGLLGIIFYIMALFYSVVILLKHCYLKYFKNSVFLSYSNLCFLIAIFIKLFPLTTSGNFFSNKTSLFIFLLLAFYFGKNPREDRNVGI